jgi:hypothetical protein
MVVIHLSPDVLAADLQLRAHSVLETNPLFKAHLALEKTKTLNPDGITSIMVFLA